MSGPALFFPAVLVLIAVFAMGFMPTTWGELFGMVAFLALALLGIVLALRGLTNWSDLEIKLLLSLVATAIGFGGSFGIAGQAIVIARGGRNKGATAAVFAVLMVGSLIGTVYFLK
jgi:hypothetical protein